MKSLLAFVLVAGCGVAVTSAQDSSRAALDASLPAASTSTRSTEVAFGPEGGAEALVVKTITNAKFSIRLAAFAFSSPVIVDALLAAKRRGVDVQIVVDRKHNIDEDNKGFARNALGTLVRSGIPVRTNSNYRIHHDKFMVVDTRHVQTGSYNYVLSANRNSENVLVIWNDPALAAKYLAHWESRFKSAEEYAPG